jgi:hypothetical protein
LHGDNRVSVLLDWEEGTILSAEVLRMKGSSKLVRDVRVGERVVTVLDGNLATTTVFATVKQPLRKRREGGREGVRMCAIGEAALTPGHPVRMHGEWMRASEAVENAVRIEEVDESSSLEVCKITSSFVENENQTIPSCREVFVDISETYNFCLASRSSLLVNGLEVSTLGQFCAGVDDENSFFGTEAVVDELRERPDFPAVTLRRSSASRR